LEQIAKGLRDSGKTGELEQLASTRDGKKLSGMIDGVRKAAKRNETSMAAAIRSGSGRESYIMIEKQLHHGKYGGQCPPYRM
jgi:hypothetical protein